MAEKQTTHDDSNGMLAGGLGSYLGADGYKLRYRRYRPSSEPKGAILCIHGIQSHAGWYDSSCRHLAQQGLDVFFVDRRGSGMNSEDRGFCTGFGQLRDDLRRGVAHVRALSPDRKVFLVAISWGAKLAIATLKRYPTLVDGLVLVCPGIAAQIGPTFRERLQIGGSFVFWPRRPIRVPLTDPHLFTDSAEWQEFLRNDKKLLRMGTARLLMTSVFLDREIRGAAASIQIPALTFLAGKDRIIDNERVRRYVDGFASADKKVVHYPDAHHTLEFEPDPTPFFRDLSAWLHAHAANENAQQRRTG